MSSADDDEDEDEDEDEGVITTAEAIYLQEAKDEILCEGCFLLVKIAIRHDGRRCYLSSFRNYRFEHEVMELKGKVAVHRGC